jgi:hypothetical protein
MRIALYTCAGSGRRSRYIADAMRQGLLQHGINKVEVHNRFRGVCADIAIAYGWVHSLVFEAYEAAGGQYVYFDLGYWNRRPSTSPLDGHYRLAVNNWDTAKAMRRACPDDRFKRLGIRLKPPQLNGRDIVIASMSLKSAKTHKFDIGEWEQAMRKRLSAMGLKFPIVQRPKPAKKQAPLPAIEHVLSTARILVTRHSNTAVDAMVSGVPFYAERGVGSLLSAKDLTCEMIETPTFCNDVDRHQLLADIAYAQWTPPEMRSGEAWDHMRQLLCV